jgi:hypothetical protein
MYYRPFTLCCHAILLIVVLAGFAQASNYSSAVNSYGADLLSYWQFNGPITAGGTSTDSTGQRNGTYNSNGGTIGVGAGIPLAGMGANQSMSVAGGAYMGGSADGVSNSLPSGNDARTYTGWIDTTNSGATGYHDVFYYGTNGFGQSIFTLAPPSSTDGGFGPTANIFGVSTYNPDAFGNSVINDGAWHMLAFTVSPTTTNMANVTLYVDGVNEGAFNIGTNTTAHSSFWMGNDALTDPYTGLIAQVAVFNSALSDSQIAALYHAAQATPEPSSLVLAGLALVGLACAARRRK